MLCLLGFLVCKRHILHTLIVLYAFDILDVVTFLGNLPTGKVPWRWVVVVKRSQKVLKGQRGLVSIIEGDFVEEVVSYTRASNLVVEKAKDSVGSVDGGKGALHKGPLFGSVLWYGGVRMLQPCIENQPEVGPHVRTGVPERHSEESVVERQLEQKSKHSYLSI